jgi:trans-L-3-hydroxyproline dehydratase
MFAKGSIGIGEQRIFESITGARFTGEISRLERSGPHDAIIARVGGRAHYSGEASYIVEEDDPLGGGFLLR